MMPLKLEDFLQKFPDMPVEVELKNEAEWVLFRDAVEGDYIVGHEFEQQNNLCQFHPMLGVGVSPHQYPCVIRIFYRPETDNDDYIHAVVV